MITAGDARGVVRVADRIDEHVRAEFTSDPDVIGGTISADAFFPLLVRSPDGIRFEVLTEKPAIRDYYEERLGTFEILDSTRVHQQRSEWWGFHETVATVRHVGDFNGVPGTGGTYRVHSAVLFPTADDGIVGELEWTRYDFADIFRGTVRAPRPPDGLDAHLPMARVEAAVRHERLVAALAAGDGDAALAELTPGCHWAARHAHARAELPPLVQASGHDAVRRHLEDDWSAWHGRELRILNRYATEWFVFAEWLVGPPPGGGGATARMVTLDAVADDGRFLAHLGYSVDVA